MDLEDFRGYLTFILVIVMLLVLLLLLLLVRSAGSFQRVSLGLFVGQLLFKDLDFQFAFASLTLTAFVQRTIDSTGGYDGPASKV
jgi:hypothetical protein